VRGKVLVAALWGGAFSLLTAGNFFLEERAGSARWVLFVLWVVLFGVYVGLAFSSRRSANLREDPAFLIGRPLAIALSIVLCVAFGPAGLFFFGLAFAVPCVLLASIRDKSEQSRSDAADLNGGIG
jgi:steroid 5-alpha reductase family enzyme